MGEVRVIVVDDDADLRFIVARMLAKEGIDVDEATNVDELFTYLEDGGAPDLILLDLTMPGPSGWKVFPQLKSDPKTANIPVIVVTGHDDPEFKAAAKSRGAAGYLTKPFRDWELTDAVKRYIKLSRRADPWA
jgi:CheY-like chemotaxis protein